MKDNEVRGIGNSLDFGARMYDNRIARWFARDPLEKKFIGLSPYNFVANNPVRFVDLDGKDIFIYGVHANNAALALQTNTTLRVNLNNATNQLTFSGTPVTSVDFSLYQAANDRKVNVNLFSTSANAFKSRDGSEQGILIGGFDGSSVDRTIVPFAIEANKVNTFQYYNFDHSRKAEQAGLSTAGKDVTHELLESYFAGRDDPGNKGGGGDPKDRGWSSAHDKALQVDPISELDAIGTSRGDVGLMKKGSKERIMLYNSKDPNITITNPEIEKSISGPSTGDK